MVLEYLVGRSVVRSTGFPIRPQTHSNTEIKGV